mmetsp:Transcript_59944/g.169859  ORF Transcript_59944/g.169859 Transcript_59944/m.169859 type:complete len:217 (+) Transcript_59944:108-758(+)
MLQFIVMAESMAVLRFDCTKIADNDSNWTDGVYNGSYTFRSPPSHECASSVAEFESMFAKVLYGMWVSCHAVFLLCPRVGGWLVRPRPLTTRLSAACSTCSAMFARCMPAALKCDWWPYRSWKQVYWTNCVLAADKLLAPGDGDPYGGACVKAQPAPDLHGRDALEVSTTAVRQEGELQSQHSLACDGQAPTLLGQAGQPAKTNAVSETEPDKVQG